MFSKPYGLLWSDFEIHPIFLKIPEKFIKFCRKLILINYKFNKFFEITVKQKKHTKCSKPMSEGTAVDISTGSRFQSLHNSFFTHQLTLVISLLISQKRQNNVLNQEKQSFLKNRFFIENTTICCLYKTTRCFSEFFNVFLEFFHFSKKQN